MSHLVFVPNGGDDSEHTESDWWQNSRHGGEQSC